MLQHVFIKESHHKFLIIGGGTAGITTASLLRRSGQTDVAIIEPSGRHFYQPLWTLVGGGVAREEASVRDEAGYIPKGVHWIQEEAVELDPERRRVTTQSGARIGYDFLMVAAGAQLNWEAIPGLAEAIATDSVSSNYRYDLAPRTWRMIRNFRGGIALFHMPGTPIKCPGAPQKIMYLAADYFRRRGILRDTKVIYGSALPTIYGVKEYAAVLDRVVERYGIDARYNHQLVEVRPEKREAVFEIKSGQAGERVTIPYDLLHVAPPQSAPDFIRQSSLADPENRKEGWVKVNKNTLQHVKYADVFALGDVAGTPNSKTGASAAREAPVVAANVLAVSRGEEPQASFDGYVACPIVTGYGRMLLCEVDYTGRPAPRLPLINTIQERRDMWLLKRYGLPWLYWNVLLRGRSLPFLGGAAVARGIEQREPGAARGAVPNCGALPPQSELEER